MMLVMGVFSSWVNAAMKSSRWRTLASSWAIFSCTASAIASKLALTCSTSSPVCRAVRPA